MKHWVYLLALLVTLGCLALCDYRYKLALFSSWRKAAGVLLIAEIVFLVWDIVGIKLNIFLAGTSTYSSGRLIMNNLPIEEPFFLLLLNYSSLIVWRKISQKNA
jgi:lycopene cyclase domain-containing protein